MIGRSQRHGPVQRAVGIGHHPQLGELGQVRRHGIGQRELALLDQAIAAATVTGLLIDAIRKMVSRCIGRPGVDVAVAEFVDLQHLARLPHQGDRARQQARVDRLADGRLVAVEIHPASLVSASAVHECGC